MTSNGSVIIVDDDPAVRNALCTLMEAVDLPVKSYAHAQAFLDHYDPSEAGCIVLDIRMPDISGLQLQKILKSKAMDIPVVIISGHGDIRTAVEAMKSGAVDFIQKPFDPAILLERIRHSLELNRRRREEESRKQEVAKRIALLTPRELDVLKLLAQGKSSKQTSELLGISPKTVDAHRLHITLKLRVESLVDLAILAHTYGLSDTPSPS